MLETINTFLNTINTVYETVERILGQFKAAAKLVDPEETCKWNWLESNSKVRTYREKVNKRVLQCDCF